MQECNIPVLHNWVEMPYVADDLEKGVFLWGHIYNDDRHQNGKLVRTSKVIAIDKEQGILKTKNTLYDLGKEYKQ